MAGYAKLTLIGRVGKDFSLRIKIRREMKRENGFYWVKFTESLEWDLAKWGGRRWRFFWSEEVYTDDELHQINEERIKTPDEP